MIYRNVAGSTVTPVRLSHVHYERSEKRTGRDEQNHEEILRVSPCLRSSVAREWTGRDLNPRPPRCKRGDLPADLPAPAI